MPPEKLLLRLPPPPQDEEPCEKKELLPLLLLLPEEELLQRLEDVEPDEVPDPLPDHPEEDEERPPCGRTFRADPGRWYEEDVLPGDMAILVRRDSAAVLLPPHV